MKMTLRRSAFYCLIVAGSLTLLCARLYAQMGGSSGQSDRVKVVVGQLGDVVLKSGSIVLNNFNLLHEEAFFGGYKVTMQVSGKNTSDKDVNYTVYVFCKAKEADVCCFKIEPELNVHEPGKVETLTDSGMLTQSDFKSIDTVLLKVVVQKSNE